MVPNHSEDHSSCNWSLDLLGDAIVQLTRSTRLCFTTVCSPCLVLGIFERTRGPSVQFLWVYHSDTLLSCHALCLTRPSESFWPLSHTEKTFPLTFCCLRRYSGSPIWLQASRMYFFSECRHCQESGRTVESMQTCVLWTLKILKGCLPSWNCCSIYRENYKPKIQKVFYSSDIQRCPLGFRGAELWWVHQEDKKIVSFYLDE